MNTPHQDGLPALPAPVWPSDYINENDKYSATQMRDYALLALRSAAPSAQPVQQARELTDEQIERAFCEAFGHRPPVIKAARQFTRAILAAASADAQPVVPAGFALVPVEPTVAMLDAAAWHGTGYALLSVMRKVWATMLAAAPTPQPVEKQAVPLSGENKRAMWVAATIELCSHENCYLRGIEDAERAHGITPPADEGEKA
jgi:hypothetical protein